MARVDFNPLDFGSILPEELSAPDADLSQYLPQELPPERTARRRHEPVSSAVAKDLPPEARALLDTIAMDESPDYNTIFGGQKFDDYSRHPGVYVPIKKGPNAGKRSSAAGRYQFLKSTWDEQAAKLGLTDFSPESQDRAAWNYAQEVYGNKTGRDLLADLKTNDPRFQRGITEALSSVWTSMPSGIEQRSGANKFLDRYAQSLAQQGVEAPQAGPTGDTYDIPLSNGQTFTVPKSVSREDAIAGLRAQGMNVEGVKDHPLTNGKTLTLPESFDVNEALKQLQAQHPDQEWMTKEHAEKTGFLPAAEAAFKGLLPQAKRGAGEIFEEFGPTREMGRNWIEESKKAQEELAKVAEKPLPTDPLSKQIAYYGGTAAGGFLPFVAGAALAPELAVPLALGSTPILAAGSLGQRYDEEGKPLELSEPRNLAALGAETALQTAGLRGLAPVAGQFTKSAIKGALGAAAADVPSVAIERAAAGQPLTDEEALKEYGGALAADVLGGGTLGAAGALRGRGRAPKAELPPETPPAPETPIQPAPEGGAPITPETPMPEGVAPEAPIIPEEQAAFDVTGEAGITPQEAELVAAAKARAEAEAPEPTVRGEAQAMPMVEEPAPLSFADLGLKGKNSKVLMRSLNELDMENPEHGKTINEILDRAEEANVQHNPEAMQAIRTKLQEVQDAQQIPQAGEALRRSGAQPGFREEGRDQAIGGEGVEPSGQRIETPEVKAPEEIKATIEAQFKKGAKYKYLLQQHGEKAAQEYLDSTVADVMSRASVEKPMPRFGEGEKESLKQVGDLGAGITESLYKDLWKGYSGEGAMRADPIVQTAHKIAEHRQAKFNETEFKSFAKEFGGADTPEAKAEIANRFAAGKPEEIATPEISKAEGIAPEAAHSVESLNDHIVKTYGENAPQVEVLTREQAGVEPNVKGFYDPNTKKVALIADNIGKDEDIHGLMRHEVAVHAKRLGKTDPEFQSILDRLQKLKEQGDATVAKAYDRVPRDTTPENIHEEALAYLTQHAPKLPIVKQFTSWMRRTAHKLTGGSNWLKADDFAPMADAILKKGGEPTVTPKARMYAKEGPDFLRRVSDYARGTKYGEKGAASERDTKAIVKESIRKNASPYERMEEFYNAKIRKHFVAHDTLLDMLGKDDPTMAADGKVRAKLHRDQAKRWAQLVTNSLQRGYTAYDPKTGVASIVDDARLAPVNLINRMNKLSISPEAFSNAMIIMTKQGHRLRQSDRAKAIADAKSNLRYVNSQIDYLKELAQQPKSKVSKDDIESARKVANQIRMRIANLSKRYKQMGGEEGPYAKDITPEMVADAKRIFASYPDAAALRDDILESYRKDAKMAYDSGLVSKAAYENFIKDKYAYTPLYMSAEELEGDMPGFISTMGGQKTVKGPKTLTAGEHAVNFAENMLTHKATMVHHALKNSAEVATLNSPGLKSLNIVHKISDPTFAPAKGAAVVAVKEDGNTRYYKVDNQDVYDAFGVINNMGLPKFLEKLPEITKFQSRMAIMTPVYWGDQMAREPFMATFTSNVGLISPVHMLGEFVGLMSPHFTGKETSASRIYKDLQAQGVTGSHEYIKNMQAQFAKGSLEKSLPKKMWNAWAGIHEYIDASAKVAVMRKAEKLAREGKLGPTGEKLSKEAAHLEAVAHVQDMFNLTNRGSHAAMTYAMQVRPFINSWAQGLDALVRNATGINMSEAQRKRAVTQFWTKALTLAALYAAFTQLRISNSEDYRESTPEEWSTHILIPGVDGMEKYRMFHAKQPFEVGAMFMFPVEAAVRYFNGLDRGKNYWKTSGDVMWKSFAPPGLEQYMAPSGLTPIVELGFNQRMDIRNLFGKESTPIKKEGVAAEYQGIGKNELADGISKLTGGTIAPATINFLGQQYFSGLYNALGAIANGIGSTFGTKTGRAELRDITERVPFIRGFITNPDLLDQATVYDILSEWKEPKTTGKYAIKRGLPGGEKYLEKAGMAKAAERFSDIINKTNIAIEQLKNDPAYVATEEARKKAEKDYKDLIKTKREIFKEIERLHSEE